MKRKPFHCTGPRGTGKRVKPGWRVSPATRSAVEAKARDNKTNPGRLLDLVFGPGLPGDQPGP